jgi:hypothetical protein
MRQRGIQIPSQQQADALPRLALTHGQTIWLMTELGLHDGVSMSTFNYYIKSLRKLGVPFDKGKGQFAGHRHVRYDYEELMELTVALLLRVYGTLPDAIIAGLRHFRGELHAIYRQAYFESISDRHTVAKITEPGGKRAIVGGLFLDLNIRYSAGQMIEFGPPKIVSPFEAILTYTGSDAPARSYLPLNVTAVARMVTTHSRTLPPIRRNRQAG